MKCIRSCLLLFSFTLSVKIYAIQKLLMPFGKSKYLLSLCSIFVCQLIGCIWRINDVRVELLPISCLSIGTYLCFKDNTRYSHTFSQWTFIKFRSHAEVAHLSPEGVCTPTCARSFGDRFSKIIYYTFKEYGNSFSIWEHFCCRTHAIIVDELRYSFSIFVRVSVFNLVNWLINSSCLTSLTRVKIMRP